MTRPILNLDEVDLKPMPPEYAATGPAAERYAPLVGQLGTRVGAQKLGYNVTALPPGKRAYPRHNHWINEEMFLVLAGQGEVCIGEATYPLRAGDVIACPPGGPETAHQIRNTGAEELRYLAISTRMLPEVVEYPDSGKFGVKALLGPDAEGKPQSFQALGRDRDAVHYWDGE